MSKDAKPAPKKEVTNKISDEQAEMEFDNFVEAMDLDVNMDTMDENDKGDFIRLKQTVINAVVKGSLVFNDDHEPVFTPTHSSASEVGPITFYEPTGANFMEMDRKKAGHDIGKTHALMAGITKKPAKLFAGLKNRDYKVCNAIVMIFLG